MTDAQNSERITGKRVLADAIVLFKDTGLLICELSKTVIAKIKTLIDNAQKQKADKDEEK